MMSEMKWQSLLCRWGNERQSDRQGLLCR